MKKLLLLLACGLAVLASARAGVSLSLDPKGVAIEAGTAGRFVVPAPDHTGGGQTLKPVWTPSDDGKTGRITYENGFEVRVTIDSVSGTITYDYADASFAPGSALRFMTLIPISFNEGGRYSVDKAPLVEFPVDFVDQLLVRGEATRVDIVGPLGEGFSVDAPACWQAIQDNRKWGWKAFAWVYLYDLNKVPSRRAFTFKISAIKP